MGEASVVVSENETPTASISGALAYCAGDSTLLMAPAGIAQYLWSDGSNAEELAVTAPGTYGLTVTNSVGCADSTAVEVEEAPLPEPIITG
ncbi:hypothetical protein RZS08_56570, partial [Arthrospira platensis SPKY1]|nr:hypothetical protein [Arthrospira platensis SPKY1]